MTKRSKLIIFVPVVLLLVRNIVPVVHGQLNPVGWNYKSDRGSPYRFQSALLSIPDRAVLPNPSNQYWAPILESFPGTQIREMVEIQPSMWHNIGAHPQQQLPADLYALLKEQRHVPLRSSSTGADVLESLNNKLLDQQPHTKRQDQKEIPAALLAPGNGIPIDYPSIDDDTSAAQQPVQPAGSLSDDYSQSPSPSKPKIKSRQEAPTNGLPRYLTYGTLKRARDGYICHFKLCQVGVSGKRLSNM